MTPQPQRHPSHLILTLAATFLLLVTLLAAAGTSRAGRAETHQVFLPTAMRPLDAVGLTLFAAGLKQPTVITHAGDERIFVAERAGTIRILGPDGMLAAEPFLDIRSQVVTEFWEQGLLGLVFHPDYATNGQFYLFYSLDHTDEGFAPSRLSRFLVDPANPDRALPESEQEVLTIPQLAEYHHAGDLHFGPDGYLYVAVGDGGGEADAQEVADLRGAILRLDVDNGGDAPYAIPPDNPYLAVADAAPELWAIGLRNPWRIAFSDAGDLFIADVGALDWEEVNVQRAGSTGGQNYGWPCTEGFELRDTPLECREDDVLTEPAFVYGHNIGRCSIIGGQPYSGDAYPAMRDYYFFADLCESTIWTMAPPGYDQPAREVGRFYNLMPGTFGRDADGELYVAGHTTGVIYQVVPGQ